MTALLQSDGGWVLVGVMFSLKICNYSNTEMSRAVLPLQGLGKSGRHFIDFILHNHFISGIPLASDLGIRLRFVLFQLQSGVLLAANFLALSAGFGIRELLMNLQ